MKRAVHSDNGEKSGQSALKTRVGQAVARNSSGSTEGRSRVVKATPAAANPKGAARRAGQSAAIKRKNPLVAAKPTLLAGGNPQIAKADGDAAVQSYIAAMPGWKRDVGRRLDALIVRTV